MKTRIDFDWEWDLPALGYADPVLMIGSCFSQSMGALCNKNRLNVISNPLGTQYNPGSILHNLQLLQGSAQIQEKDLIQNQKLWYYTNAHHDLFGSTQDEITQKLNAIIQPLREFWQQVKFVWITPGTAQYYQYVPTGNNVGNCHKLPSQLFKKQVFTPKQIEESFSEFIESEPQKHFIFTLSPVRYVREGLIESNHHKSILRIAIHALQNQFKQVHYFPSYEILVDELRDYRYYAEDMLHPSTIAIEYIYDTLIKRWGSPTTLQYLAEWHKIKKRLEHQITPQTPPDFAEKNRELLQLFEQKWKPTAPKPPL